MQAVGLRAKALALVGSQPFQRFIIFIILANAVTLGLESFPTIYAEYGRVLKAIDRGFLAVFAAELTLKLYAYRVSFFKGPWNWFDAIIVAASLVPNAGAWSVLRVLRLFRLFSAIGALRNVVEALLRALPGMGAIVAVLGVVFYVAAVAATQLFGRDPNVAYLFGSLDRSAYTLFRVMTLDGWSEISDATMQHFPLALVFFIPFIILTSFAVLNLFIAVIVEALGAKKAHDHAPEPLATATDIASLREDIQRLSDVLAARERSAATD